MSGGAFEREGADGIPPREGGRGMSKLNEMAQARGYFEGLEGKERYPRAFHPNQYGAYNLGHKHGTFIRESGQ